MCRCAIREVSAVVPAAGLSRRFGGPNKLLQPWGSSTVIGSVVQTLVDCGLPVILVTGRDAADVAALCPEAQAVFNPRFAEGLGGSIAAGTVHVGPGRGILVALGDMPGLRTEVVLGLIEAYHGDTDILAPCYAHEPGRPGHPVLFGSAHRRALMGLSGDEGARSLMRLQEVTLLPFPGSLSDIDVAEELPGSAL